MVSCLINPTHHCKGSLFQLLCLLDFRKLVAISDTTVYFFNCYVEPLYMYVPGLLRCLLQFFLGILFTEETHCPTQFVESVSKTGKHSFLHDTCMMVFGHLYAMLENLFWCVKNLIGYRFYSTLINVTFTILLHTPHVILTIHWVQYKALLNYNISLRKSILSLIYVQYRIQL